MSMKKYFLIEEAACECEVEETIIIEYIENEWIQPAEPTAQKLDEEDLARIRLIENLREQLGVNDEAVPIILHLLDQLHHYRHRLAKNFDESDKE
jgi:chaperone modulatory protein CbpM